MAPTDADEAEKNSTVEHGDFTLPDGSGYTGEYVMVGEQRILQGQGQLQSGPDTYTGTFDKGAFRYGEYLAFSGARYVGNFNENLYHGVGEYHWQDGRIYKGTWKNGNMHGKGHFINFSRGVDGCYTGFAIDGAFTTVRKEQAHMREKFLAVYNLSIISSALAALKALPASPEEYLVQLTENDTGTGPTYDAEEVVLGPYTSSDAVQGDAVAGFVACIQDGGGSKISINVFEDKEPVPAEFSLSFDGAKRLRRDQLQCVGQAVGFENTGAGADAIALMIFINVAKEFDVSCAKWKLVHLENGAGGGVPP